MPKTAVDGRSLEISAESLASRMPAKGLDAEVAVREGAGLASDAATLPMSAAPPAQILRIATLVETELSHGRAFLFAPVFLGLGAVLWFSADRDPVPALYQVGFFVSLILALTFRHRSRALGLSAMAGTLVAAGMALASFETARKDTVVLDSPVTVDITGRVLSREAMARGGWRYTVELLSTAKPKLKRPPERIALVASGRHQPLFEGEGITGRARISPPSGPAMPGLSDFGFPSYFQQIGAIGFFYGAPRRADAVPPPERNGLTQMTAWIGHLRAVIGERIRSIIPGDAGAFATAMVTDERRAMTRETAEALRLSGLAHIIAISGLNMALSAGIFFVGLRMALSLHQGMAQAMPIKKIAAFGALVGVTAYYLLSGSAVSAERAWLMMSVMLIAVLIGRPSISMRNVALSALIILVLSPSDVMGASFQMSFAATAALVAGYALLRDRAEEEGRPSALPGMAALAKTGRFFWSIALTSIIGGVSTAIFSVAHFQQLALWGLPANLAAMPIVSFIVMPTGLIAMLLMPFGLDAWPLMMMGYGLDLVINVAKEVASWGGDGASGLLPDHIFPIVVVGFLLLTLLRTRLRYSGVAIILAAFTAAFMLPKPPDTAIIIAESGDLVGLIDEDAIATNRERPPSFIFAQWQRALDIAEHVRPGMTKRPQSTEKANSRTRDLSTAETQAAADEMIAALVDTEPGRFTCVEKLWCVARYARGVTEEAWVAVAMDAAYVPAACASVDIIITPVRLRRPACPPHASTAAVSHQNDGREGNTQNPVKRKPLLITGVTLSRHGSIALRFEEGDLNRLHIETARNGSVRPWNRHRLYDWRRGVFDERDDITPLAGQ